MNIEIDKVYNMDCLELMREMPDKSVDAILTDIPYGKVNRNDNGLRELDKANADIVTFDMEELSAELYRVCKGNIIIFCGTEQLSTIREYYNDKGTTRVLVWEKTNPSPMNGEHVYLSGIELAVWFKPKGGHLMQGVKTQCLDILLERAIYTLLKKILHYGMSY